LPPIPKTKSERENVKNLGDIKLSIDTLAEKVPLLC
jgi:hypothetical protein